MQTSIIVLIITAAITATRSRRNTRWPLFAAIAIALLPFAARLVVGMARDAAEGALMAFDVAQVSWPVAWALFLGWFFRPSRGPFLPPATKRKHP